MPLYARIGGLVLYGFPIAAVVAAALACCQGGDLLVVEIAATILSESRRAFALGGSLTKLGVAQEIDAAQRIAQVAQRAVTLKDDLGLFWQPLG